ncbi:UNVERIFIED_CONTAM: hypothetical protein RMT77_008820 [Armadillidium vulgare]
MKLTSVFIVLLYQFMIVIVKGFTISEDSEYLEKNDTLKSSCNLPSGVVGRCVNIFDCPSVLSTFTTIKPVYCEYSGRIPTVCCPPTKKESLLQIRRVRPNENVPVPDEFAFLKCGLSLKYLKVHALGKSHEHKLERRRNRNKRNVVGGEESDEGEFPWIALVGMQENSTSKVKWICDGVLIHPQWVVTAAHCLLDFSKYKIRLGEHDITSDSEPTQKDFTIIKTLFYPDFKLDVAYHDLAIVKLSSRVETTESIMPVCLPWKPLPKLIGKKATLAGWGAESFGGGLSSVLRDADVRIFDSSVCNKSYSTLRDYKMLWPRGIKSNFLLCAGARNGGIDSCQGDSGGPLVYRRNKHVELIGIVSKGFGCGLQEFPGLYITIRTYLLWICEMILRD